MTPASPAARNPGVPMADAAWPAFIAGLPADTPTAAEPTAPPPSGSSAGEAAAPASLLRLIRCTDLTTLAGDDTPERVRRLCAQARAPLAPALAAALGAPGLTVAAVCVYPALVPVALAALAGSGIPVASVAAGFPAGLSPWETRVREVEWAVAHGAAEIDIVIRRHLVLDGDWAGLYREVRALRQACGPAHLKVILSTGELGTTAHITRASWVAMMAGADFIKTSTGKEAVNATPEAARAMVHAIRGYRDATGHAVGFKAAGGIGTAAAALGYLRIAEEALGAAWGEPALLRLGASSLLADIGRVLQGGVSPGDGAA